MAIGCGEELLRISRPTSRKSMGLRSILTSALVQQPQPAKKGLSPQTLPKTHTGLAILTWRSSMGCKPVGPLQCFRPEVECLALLHYIGRNPGAQLLITLKLLTKLSVYLHLQSSVRRTHMLFKTHRN